ncbi:acyl-CoA thioesterase II [Nocardioides jiangxiensis]|uniref:Acyl-CoA thioesterase II n=1 Tax=Nocardioides jiangxiensis TaxID=3064524 RepID=A0ABT9B456_9ACTN|nr:acyl-CoA thioesterase II [Nocardioides sp. WY-20]MDO7869498.1 acyl-CoA thioesterase II [Nocardioides sp. WY-20]
MPTSAAELVDLLDLETIDVNLFRGRQPITFFQRVFGGQVAGQAMIAAERTAPAGMTMHSLHSYFLRPGDPNVPIIYDVERIRDGSSFATRRVEARQHGRPIYYLTASFQVQEEGLDHQDVMPPVPAPEDCPASLDLLRKRAPESYVEVLAQEWSVLDMRAAGDSRAGGALEGDPDHPARQRFWVRVQGELPDDPMIHKAALTYLSDVTLLGTALVVHGTSFAEPDMQAASLDHTVWFHRPFRADEWLLYDQVSPSASQGRGLAIGRLFTADGRLVASTAQEGLIRLRR